VQGNRLASDAGALLGAVSADGRWPLLAPSISRLLVGMRSCDMQLLGCTCVYDFTRVRPEVGRGGAAHTKMCNWCHESELSKCDCGVQSGCGLMAGHARY